MSDIYKEFGVDVLRDSENAGPTAAEVKMAQEITRLREQLHLANIDAIGANAEANDLRDRVRTLSELLSEYMRACGSLVSPRIEKKAIAALGAKP